MSGISFYRRSLYRGSNVVKNSEEMLTVRRRIIYIQRISIPIFRQARPDRLLQGTNYKKKRYSLKIPRNKRI